MKYDKQLETAIHALIHVAEHNRQQRLITSVSLAVCLETNPVVVRRMMARLRQGRLVSSQKGHGGGWLLAQAPQRISLRMIYEALHSHEVIIVASHHCEALHSINDYLRDIHTTTEIHYLNTLATHFLSDLYDAHT